MKNIILIAVISICFVPARGQQQSLLLEEYRVMAVEYNHNLKAAQKNIAVSMEFENMARADLKPKFSAGANFQYTGNPMELNLNIPALDTPLSFKGRSLNYGASLSLQQPIYTGGRLTESIRIAKLQQTHANASADVVMSEVCFQTDIQYWNTVARKEMVGIANDFHNSISSLVQTIKERVEVGLVDPQELLMAEVKLNEAQYQLLQAKSNMEVSRMALNSLIGVEIGYATKIDESIPILKETDIVINTVPERAELSMAQSNIKIAQSTLKLNDAQYKPQFYVGAEGNYSSPGYNFDKDLDFNYAIYAKLSIPIFEWGKRNSRKRASKRQIEIATDNLHQVEDNINLEIQTSRVALSQAIQRVDLSLSSLGKAKENEQKALERYSEGKISILEVIDAQTYRQTSQINYVQAKAAAQGHYAEVMKALNQYNNQ
ncbi:MAG: TolC family protein [Muribaculaceae bacterium]